MFMSSAPPSPGQTKAAQLEAAREARTQRYLALLDNAIDITDRFINRLDAQAATEPAATLIVPLERAVRTLRRTMALAQKFAAPPRLGAFAREFARKTIIRDVQDVIQRSGETDREQRSLRAELLERIDAPDMDDEIDHRPVKAIITDLIRDFGLAHLPGTHPWARRTPKDIAILKAQAAQTGPP